MSRPIVLSGEHPIVWSSVYADVSDVKLSDWLWQERERAKIRKFIYKEREKRQKEEENLMHGYSAESTASGGRGGNGGGDGGGNISALPYVGPYPNNVELQEPEVTKKNSKKKAVQLLTTVATPVFDRRIFSNVTERIRSSKNIWIERTKKMRVANILGVAGTDVPIREIIKLTPPHRLGVNAYSFVVTNNGFVLYHPDLRPLFQDMLKPQYSTVDMAEVELADDDTLGPREFHDTLKEIKNLTIDRRIGWKQMRVKIHLDSLRRVVTRNNSYYCGPIENTPFTLIVALPEPYGRYRVSGQTEVKRKTEDLQKHFQGNNWRVHPDWVYCESQKKEGDPMVSPEDVIRQFINESETTQRFKWRSSSTRPPLYEMPLCDKLLVQSLVFDAKVTDVDSKKCEIPRDTLTKYEDRVMQMYGIVTTFVATRSGLLRFEDYRTEEEKENSTERPFYEVHTKATDELFYRRAVDFYYVNSSAFVFAVPFDAGTRNTSLVTASQAIFLGKGKKRAPAAVVGVQFKHSAFVERFFNMTGTCMTACKYKCTDDQMDCWLLDSNGFVVVSEVHEQTGKFFGEIDYNLFESMVHENIYRKVRLYDYQAICIDIIAKSGPATFLKTPLLHLGNIVYWLWSRIIMFFVQTNIFPWISDRFAAATDYDYDEVGYDDDRIVPNKTRPRPCDKEFSLYEMQASDNWEPKTGVLPKCAADECDKNYIFQKVPYTNLVMLVTYSDCSCSTRTSSLEPTEIIYDEVVRCERMRNGTLRKLPEPCVHHHPEEGSIGQQCGMGSLLCASMFFIVGALLLHLL